MASTTPSHFLSSPARFAISSTSQFSMRRSHLLSMPQDTEDENQRTQPHPCSPRHYHEGKTRKSIRQNKKSWSPPAVSSPETEDAAEIRAERCNLYPKYVRTSSKPLLLVNRQFRKEVEEVMSQIKNTGTLMHHLDWLLVDDDLVYPTWLVVPFIWPHVDVVETTLRLISTGFDMFDYAWRPGLLIARTFVGMIRRFVSSGPIFLSKKKVQEFRIESLNLNMVTPAAPTSFTNHSVGTHKIPNTMGMIYPGYGLNSFGYRIDEVLQSKGDTVRENVGVITLCLTGVERWRWDFRPTGDSRQRMINWLNRSYN